jgi:hypothetical protein
MSCDSLMTASHGDSLDGRAGQSVRYEAGARSYDTTMSDVDRNVLKAMRVQVAYGVQHVLRVACFGFSPHLRRRALRAHSPPRLSPFLHNLHPSRMQPTTGRREVKPQRHGLTGGRPQAGFRPRCHFKAWSNAELSPASLLKHLPRLRQRGDDERTRRVLAAAVNRRTDHGSQRGRRVRA